MTFLLDTNVLLFLAYRPETLSQEAVRLIGDPRTALAFSAVSIWEVAIKRALDRPDFQSDPRALRRNALDLGFEEHVVTSEHGAAVSDLPLIHKDPFDRLLLAQAREEGLTLLTTDRTLAAYPAPVRLV